MKQIFLFLNVIFFGFFAYAQTETVNWYVDGNVYTTTTCESGDDINLPPTPTKPGYTFHGWRDYYTPIEYLESTGPYIDTAVFLEPDAEIETKFRVVKAPATNTQWTVIYQSRGTDDTEPNVRDIGCVAYGRFLTNNNSGTNTPKLSLYTVGVDYTEHMTPSGWTINNVYYAKSGSQRTLTTPATLRIMGTNGTLRLYYFKIWNNGTLVRDFIPVLDGNGTPCMYDKAGGKFYYNAGTGQFVAGPVVSGGGE